MNRKIWSSIEFSMPEKYYEDLATFKSTVFKHLSQHLPYQIEFRIVDAVEVPLTLAEIEKQ